MKMKSILYLAVLLFSTTLFPVSSVWGGSVERPPLYLYLGEGGDVYTFRTIGGTGEGGYSFSRTPVSEREIIEIRRLGYDVLFVREPDLSAQRQVLKSVSIPELTSLPTSFALLHWMGVVYGGFYIQDTGGDGKSTHWFNTTLQVNGGEKFNGHLAVGLIADVDQLLSPYPPAMVPQGVANGIVIGNVSLNTGGCGSPPNSTPIFNMQVESFWNGGNKLYDATCYPSGLVDGVDYLIDLHASRTGHVTYINYPGGYGNPGWISPTASTAGDRPSGKPGTLSGNGFIVTLIPGPSPFEFVDFNFKYTYNGWF